MELYVSLDGSIVTVDENLREEKKTKKNGLLSWLKLKVSKISFTSSSSCILIKLFVFLLFSFNIMFSLFSFEFHKLTLFFVGP